MEGQKESGAETLRRHGRGWVHQSLCLYAVTCAYASFVCGLPHVHPNWQLYPQLEDLVEIIIKNDLACRHDF